MSITFTHYSNDEVKYFIVGEGFNAHVEKAVRGDDGHYYYNGTILAYIDKDDPDERCGVGLASLPRWKMFDKINAGCVVHDRITDETSELGRVYMAFNHMITASTFLKTSLTLAGYPTIANIFFHIVNSRIGGHFWEGLK